MTKKEFEQKISKNEHKDEILRLVEESIKLMRVKDKQSVSARFEECAQLYNDSLEDYTHFRLNLSKQIDLLRYQSFVFKYQDDVQAALSKLTQDVVMRVDAYAQNSKYNDTSIVYDVTVLLEKYTISKYYLENKMEELEDKKKLLKLSEALKNGFCFHSFKLRGMTTDETFSIKSEKMKNLFAETFLPYFENRFLEHEPNDIEQEILNLKNISETQLVHKLVYDLYTIFVQNGKLSKCTGEGNEYELIDKKGNSYKLDGEVSDWIFFLLKEFKCIKKMNIYIKKDRNRYIKDCMRDKKCRLLKLEDYSKTRNSPFL